MDVSDRDYVRQVIAAGQPYIDKPTIGRALKRPVLIMGVPVRDAAGRLRAVMAGVTDLTASDLLGFVSDPLQTGSGQYYIFSLRDRMIIAATDANRTMTPMPATGSNILLDHMAEGFEGTGIAVSSEGTTKLYSGVRVPTANWLVVAGLPTKFAFAPIEALRTSLFVAAGLLTLVALVLVRILVGRMLVPLTEASSEMRRMTEGLTPMASLAVRRQDEIGQLIGNFNRLIEDRRRYESASHAKSAFLANMSHEIRTPMNAILGLVHLMRRGGLTAEQGERLRKIDTAAEHLLCIINDILELSKIEAGKLVLEQKDFALSEIVDQVHSLIAEAARTKGLAIEVDYGDAPRRLKGDPTRVRQALLNYAGNAIKFTERGRICLRTRLEQDYGEDIVVRFEVQDTGIGIAQDKLPELFQIFEQGDASITRQYGGTGLGLAITQRLATLMNGEAGAESAMGVGSTFWFTARLRRGHAAVDVAADKVTESSGATTWQSHSAARVLLVEDDPINREVMLDMLAGIGFSIDTAEDGHQAIAKAAMTHHDLILMDMQMPRLDGLQATQAIRALPELAETPIIAMTANVFDEDRRRCIAAGMNDFIAKPFDPDILLATLTKWLPAHPEPKYSPFAPIDDANAASSQLWQALTTITGLDVGHGVVNSSGSLDRYAQFLRRYARDSEKDVSELETLITTEQFDKARRLAHSLAGAAGLLGVIVIEPLASELEDALRERRPRDEIERLAGILRSKLDSLVAALVTVLPEAEHPATASVI